MASAAAKWCATWRARLPPFAHPQSKQPAVIKFDHLSHYRDIIAHAIIDDAAYQLSQDQALDVMDFEAVVARLPPDQASGEYTSVLIAVDAGHATSMLPRIGEKCKIVVKNKTHELDLRGQLRSLLLGKIPLLSNEYQISALDLDLKETDALATLGIVNFDLADASRQATATVIRDSFHDIIRNYATTERLEDHVHQFIEMHITHLQHNKVTAADEGELLTLYAQRLELDCPEDENEYCFFTAKASLEPITETVGGTRGCDFAIPKSSMGGVGHLDLLQKAFANQKTPVRFQIFPSVRSARTEISAWLELMELSLVKPGMKARQIRDYVVNFQAGPQTQTSAQSARAPATNTAGILDKFPAFEAVAKGTAKSYLMKAYQSLDPAQKATFDAISTESKHGLVPIHGASGCGKTYMLCVTLLIAMSSGKQKGLVVLPTNAEVDDMADKFSTLRKDFGTPALPFVLRIYSRDSEVSGATPLIRPFDSDDSDDVTQCSFQDDEDGDFTALTKLSAHLAVRELLGASKMQPGARQGTNNRSLHVEALARYRKDPEAYPGLTGALRNYNLDPEPELRTRAEHEIQHIFASILIEADVVVTTPHVSRGSLLREKFRPTVVAQDDNGRSHESETMMVTSSYPTAMLHLICGDSTKCRPLAAGKRKVATDEAETSMPGVNGRRLISPAPFFFLQYEMSFIERAKLAGATIGPGLMTDHRQREDQSDSKAESAHLKEEEHTEKAERRAAQHSTKKAKPYRHHHKGRTPGRHPVNLAITCYRCGEQGHLQRNCPYRSAIVCFKCREEGHIARDCPKNKPSI